MRKPSKCDHCDVADRGEVIFWAGFMVGFAVGIIILLAMVAVGKVP